MRQLVLALLEPLSTLFILLNTIIGFISGGFFGGMIKMLISPDVLLMGSSEFEFSVIGGLIFAVIYFAVSVVAAGAIFVLLEIKDLLQQQQSSL